MTYILLFLILSILSIFFVIKFKKTMEECFILSIGSIIVIIFIFGVFINLEIGFFAVLLATFLALIYEVIHYKDLIKNKGQIFTYGYLAIVIFYIILIWANHGRLISLWDEFSHWGMTVKNMFEFGEFSSIPASTALFKDYPPATSIFQYFAVRLSGSWNESIIYVAMYTMMFSALAILFKYIKSKKIFSFLNTMFLIFLIVLVPTLLYPYVYITLQVDTMLGVLFASILITYFFSKKKTKFMFFQISLLSVLLVLTKQMGTFFSLMALLIIAIDYCFIQNKFSWKKIFKVARPILVVFGSIVLALLLWEISLLINEAPKSWTTPITLGEIAAILTGSAPSYRYSVIKSFIDFIFVQPLEGLTGSLSTLKWGAIILITTIIVSIPLVSKKETLKETIETETLKMNSSIKKSYITIFIGLLIYIGILLFSYLFKFSEWEAVRLASFARYLSSYLVAIIIYIFAIYVMKSSENEKKFCMINSVLFGLCIIFVNINAWYELTIYARRSTNLTVERRSEYIEFEEIYKEHIEDGDKIYFITTNNSGGPYYIGRYLATPTKVQGPVWSLGKPYSDEDIYTVDISVSEWKEEIIDGKYTHVYLHNVDEEFEGIYKELFDTETLKNNQLYEVNKEEETILKLVS